MKFEWTVNVGNVLTAFGLLLGFVAAHIQNVRRLESIETKVGLVFEWFLKTVVMKGGGDHD